LTVVCVPVAAQDAARMDQVVKELVDAKQFMGTVLVAKGDRVIVDKAYGSANLEWGTANTTNTKFRIGSVTKQFTAASILLLEERGKLKVEDPIKRFVSDAPAAWDAVTLQHLMAHTSGIPNFTNAPEYDQRKRQPTTLVELIAQFKDQPLEFTPGSKMAYSNSGYILLGYVIEQAGGMSYAEFLQKNIFTPLAMQDSGYDSNSAVIPRRAVGYLRTGNDFNNADFVHMSIPHAAGALYSTTADLLRWQRALYANKVLTAASLQKMTTAQLNGYGLGLEIDSGGKRKVIRHGGGIDGFNAMLAYYPDSQVSVVALANLNGAAPGNIAGKLGALAHGEKVTLSKERREITLAPEVLQRYVGTYSLAPNISVMVTVADNQLSTQISGQGKLPAYAEAPTRFFLKARDAQFEFIASEGEVTHMVIYQNGRETKAARMSDTVAERREIALAPSTLGQYVGTYALRPGLDLVVKVENTQLILEPTGQPRDELFAESETKFFSKRVDATLEFMRDEQGKVTELELVQGAFKGRARRQ
jgi:CubicO group peptidase (beta-lactamase class C family)